MQGWGRLGVERPLSGEGIDPGTIVASAGLNLKPHSLSKHCADETADAVRLPSRSLRDFVEGDALGPFKKRLYLRRLATSPRGRGFLVAFGRRFAAAGLVVGRLCLHGRAVGPLCRDVGLFGRLPQALDSRPDSRQCPLAVRELLDRSNAWQTVPDFREPARLPSRRQFA